MHRGFFSFVLILVVIPIVYNCVSIQKVTQGHYLELKEFMLEQAMLDAIESDLVLSFNASAKSACKQNSTAPLHDWYGNMSSSGINISVGFAEADFPHGYQAYPFSTAIDGFISIIEDKLLIIPPSNYTASNSSFPVIAANITFGNSRSEAVIAWRNMSC